MKNFTILFLICIYTSNLFAQNISGFVVEATSKKTIKDATIKLVNKTSNKLEANTTTNNLGAFNFTKINAGNYIVEISHVGFISISKNINIANSNLVIDTIYLERGTNSLKNITITQVKNVSKVNVDKKVFNVTQDATANGGSAGDVLKNVPGLIVDPNNGGIQIRGNSNVTLLVDGKPSAIFGDDIASAMQAIPGSSIESVEVIDKPGAQYDAQGKGGIVNIILKKDRKAGYNGSAGLTIGLPQRINGNINFNANVKKWNFFVNANARYSKNFILDTITRSNTYNDTNFLNYAFTNRLPYSAFINTGFDYNINKFNKISFTESLFGADMAGDVNTRTNTYNNNFLLANNIRSNNYNGHPRALTTTVGYKKTYPTPGKEWSIDASLSLRKYKRESDFITNYYDANNVLLPISTAQSIPVKGGNNNLTISTDYQLPLKKSNKVEFGAKLILFAFRSENFPTYSFNNGAVISDAALKNKFNFTQETKAAYANYKSSFKSYSYQIGMRYEHFMYDGYVVQYAKNVGATFSNFFPSAFINKKINTKSDVTLSYTKRVNRPNFFQLIPYIDFTNPQDTSMGNPFLKPEFVHATELSYMYNVGKNNSILASIYYQYNSNLIQQLKRFNANGTSFSQPQNLSSGATYGAEFNIKYYFSKIWDANLNINAFNILLNTDDGASTRNGYGGFAKLITNYKLLQKWDLQLAANYFAPTTITQGFIKAYGNVDVAIKRNFLQNKLTLTLSGNDIFNTTQQLSVFNTIPIYYQTNFRKNQTQQISIGANYRFLSKGSKPGDGKGKTFGKDGKEVKKDVKNRDENLKKDEGGDGEAPQGGGK